MHDAGEEIQLSSLLENHRWDRVVQACNWKKTCLDIQANNHTHSNKQYNPWNLKCDTKNGGKNYTHTRTKTSGTTIARARIFMRNPDKDLLHRSHNPPPPSKNQQHAIRDKDEPPSPRRAPQRLKTRIKYQQQGNPRPRHGREPVTKPACTA